MILFGYLLYLWAFAGKIAAINVRREAPNALGMESKQVTLNDVYGKLILLEKSMKKMDQYIEDLEFARRTEEAWQEIEEGKYIKYDSPEEFLATFRDKDADD